MKKEIALIFLIVFLLSFVQAISTDLKASYNRGENIIIKISGYLPGGIDDSQIEFKRGHVRVPFNSDLLKIDDNYYIWAIAPLEEGNYSLLINDLETTVNGQLKEVDFEQNFSIGNKLADYNVQPGGLLIDDDFDFVIYSFIDDITKISIDFPSKKEYQLFPGENSISISVGNARANSTGFIAVGIYKVPYKVIKKIDITTENSTRGLHFVPGKIDSEILKTEKTNFKIKLYNELNNTIKNVIINYNKSLFKLSKDKFDIGGDSYYEFNISLIKNVDLDEQISASYQNYSDSLSVRIRIFDESINNTGNKTNKYKCYELSGKICTINQVCSGSIISSSDGLCCVGTCKTQSTDSSGSSSWMGYLVALIVIVIIAIIFLKYKKVAPDKNPLVGRTSKNKDKMIP